MAEKQYSLQDYMKGLVIIWDVIMLPPGFEPESPARKAGMIGRTTLREHTKLLRKLYLYVHSIRYLDPHDLA